MEPVTLRTRRLTLSPPTLHDADAIFAACQDGQIQRFTTVPSPYLRADADDFVAKVAAEWASGEHLTWAMRDGDDLVGMIGLYRLDGKGTGELGYWVAAPARGRGILGEAARAVIDWAFALEDDGLGLDRLEWHAVVGNVASARSARSLGFHYEGVRRQALLSARGREDGWAAALLRGDDRMPQPWPVLES